MYAIIALGCVIIKRIERNTTLMEHHTKELLDKARKFDILYNRLINGVSI